MKWYTCKGTRDRSPFWRESERERERRGGGKGERESVCAPEPLPRRQTDTEQHLCAGGGSEGRRGIGRWSGGVELHWPRPVVNNLKHFQLILVCVCVCVCVCVAVCVCVRRLLCAL